MAKTIWLFEFYAIFSFSFRNILCAASEAATKPPASIIMSLITNRPTPERYGNPCCGVGKSPPKFGTQASGVVTRNESVTSDIPKVSNPPINPIFEYQMPKKVSVPMSTIIAPKPYANG